MAIVSIPTSIGGISLPGALGNIASGPLSALFGGKGVQTYNYPRDLATDPSKSHYVTFSIKEIVPAGYVASNKNGLVNTTDQTQLNIGTGASNAIGALGTAAINYVKAQSFKGELGQAAQNATEAVVNTVTSSAKILEQANLNISPRLTTPVGIVSLYMPDTLEANYNSSYTELSLTADTGLLQTIRELNSAGQGIAKVVNGGQSVGNLLSSDPATIDLVTKGVSKFVGLDIGQLGSVLLKGQGYSINPQMQMIYQGIGLREFNLSFTFTPKTATDSDTIDSILWLFKNYSLPTIQTGSSTSTDSMFLTPPALFNVDFLINNKSNKYLPKYGDCALLDVSVNYAPNGFAAFDNGAPVQTTLNLHFKEIEALDRSKIGTLQNRTGTGVLR
jgi:hypothetical protein